MISEPIIRAGILGAVDSQYILYGEFNQIEDADKSIVFHPLSDDAYFTLPKVKIGIGFHWERVEPQSFHGSLRICPDGLMINEIAVEEYLRSVISSEMKATAPIEFLKAHAILSRSWLMAMLARKKSEQNCGEGECRAANSENCFDKEHGCREIIKWYDRECHNRFDVCTDDHCQRYQGISREISQEADSAVRETRGIVLTFNGEVCDARFSKCCGGTTEVFSTAWESADVPYLKSIRDIAPNGECYCATNDRKLLESILNGYDLDSPNFFDWEERLSQTELTDLLLSKGGINLGKIIELRPLSRGKSGRISRLLIKGSEDSLIVGKELEIRRLLSPTHLKSSSFDVTPIDSFGNPISNNTIPDSFIFSGHGWGHGVGLCQIGAAAMASKGADYKTILNHYFRNAELTPLYN